MGVRVSDDKQRLLQSVPLFRACSPKEIAYLARVSDEARVDAGTVLAQEGHVGQEFFLIVAGEALVLLPDGTRHDLGPGDFFGEMALLDNSPRVATVTAATDMDVIVLGAREFSSALAEVPSLARNILQVLAHRLREAETRPTH